MSATKNSHHQRYVPAVQVETACIFEVGVGVGEGEMAYVQMKKVATEYSRALLASRHGFGFN